MKTIPSILTAASLLALPACTFDKQAGAISTINNTATTVSAGVALLPSGLTVKVKALIAKHPEAKPYLVSVANGLESIANAEKSLPAPDGTAATLLQWTTLIPQVGSYVSDFMAIYRLYYPTIAPTAAALTELAELIRQDAA